MHRQLETHVQLNTSAISHYQLTSPIREFQIVPVSRLFASTSPMNLAQCWYESSSDLPFRNTLRQMDVKGWSAMKTTKGGNILYDVNWIWWFSFCECGEMLQMTPFSWLCRKKLWIRRLLSTYCTVCINEQFILENDCLNDPITYPLNLKLLLNWRSGSLTLEDSLL